MEKRFDLGSKYFYVDCYKRNVQSNFYKTLYNKTIESFNGCWEHPGTKENIQDFFEAFNSLIDSISNTNFNPKYPIPIGSNNVIINGAHRLMVSKYLGITPPFTKKSKNGSLTYNYNFFINRKDHPKLEQKYADFGALQNILLQEGSPNIRSIVVYPVAHAAKKYQDIENILKQCGTIMYKKTVMLNQNGIHNLIKEMYRGEKWIGGMFPPDRKTEAKFNLCYAEKSPVTIYIHYFNNPPKIITIKEQLRQLFKIDKSSLHIPDNYKETFRIASALLNKNSIHFLNNGTNNLSKNSQNLLTKYFQKVNMDTNYCLTSSIILELYGLRTANDIDYLHYSDKKLNIAGVSPHTEKWLNYYGIHKHDIIFNPDNHFYFAGHKIATIGILKQMKLNRGEEKDKKDVISISRFI